MKEEDIKHLEWIYDRLIHLHNENEEVDYMVKFSKLLGSLRLENDIKIMGELYQRNSTGPEWLTPEIRQNVKKTWNEHVHDQTNHEGHNKRVQAILMIKEEATRNGYVIDIKKSLELLHGYCL